MNSAISSSMYPAGSAAPLVSQGLYEHPVQQKSLENAKSESEQTRQTFQDFAAGIFFSQMLKALRSGQKESAYFHGGQAEKMFQSQMDQYITESLAHDHGKAFADPLFQRYQLRFNKAPEVKAPEVKAPDNATETSASTTHSENPINLTA